MVTLSQMMPLENTQESSQSQITYPLLFVLTYKQNSSFNFQETTLKYIF